MKLSNGKSFFHFQNLSRKSNCNGSSETDFHFHDSWTISFSSKRHGVIKPSRLKTDHTELKTPLFVGGYDLLTSLNLDLYLVCPNLPVQSLFLQVAHFFLIFGILSSLLLLFTTHLWGLNLNCDKIVVTGSHAPAIQLFCRQNFGRWEDCVATCNRAQGEQSDSILGPAIPDKIFVTKWSNSVKLDRKRKVWYLFLRVF